MMPVLEAEELEELLPLPLPSAAVVVSTLKSVQWELFL
jgi:hypothetical protein